MPGIKELKTRIKSIQSTRKITRAMQLVSAAKMRKAQNAALNSRAYSALAGELISDLSPVIPAEAGILDQEDKIPDQVGNDIDMNSGLAEMAMAQLMQTYPKATKTGIIIISTNKGLVGGFNTNLLSKLRELENVVQARGLPQADEQDKALHYGADKVIAELLVMGRKAKEYAVRFNKHLLADFPKSDTWAPIENIYPLAKMVTELYQSGQYKKILIIYSQFVSTLTQKPTVKQLLPFGRESEQWTVDSGQKKDAGLPTTHYPLPTQSDYLFEPDPTEVLEHLLPRIIESQIYQAVLESDASEHSARMVMMKNATEAAGDLISDLTLTYNQLRQNKITTELSEITAGRIALE